MYKAPETFAEIIFLKARTAGSVLYRNPTTFVVTTPPPPARKAIPKTWTPFSRVTRVVLDAWVLIPAADG